MCNHGFGLASSRAMPKGKQTVGVGLGESFRKDKPNDTDSRKAEEASKHSVAGRPLCFLEVAIGGGRQGRIICELFSDITPRTAENFRQLCIGRSAEGTVRGYPLHYKGCKFHRVVPNFMIQAGDFTSHNGKGGESIYGVTFPDENFLLRHSRPGLLSMANAGANTNNSQFFITTKANSAVDFKHVVFGRVIEGMEVVKKVESCGMAGEAGPMRRLPDELPVFYTNKEAYITDCGEIVGEETSTETCSALVTHSGGQLAKRRKINVGSQQRAHLYHMLKKHVHCRQPVTYRGQKAACTRGKAKLVVDTVLKRLNGVISVAQAFVELAREHSDDLSAQRGGDLGDVERESGELDGEVEDVAFALGPGEISQVFETDQGVHLIYRAA